MIEKRYFLVVLERINRLREYAMQPIIELNNINLIINQKMLLRFKRCVFSIQQGEWVAIMAIMVLVNQR